MWEDVKIVTTSSYSLLPLSMNDVHLSASHWVSSMSVPAAVFTNQVLLFVISNCLPWSWYYYLSPTLSVYPSLGHHSAADTAAVTPTMPSTEADINQSIVGKQEHICKLNAIYRVSRFYRNLWFASERYLILSFIKD